MEHIPFFAKRGSGEPERSGTGLSYPQMQQVTYFTACTSDKKVEHMLYERAAVRVTFLPLATSCTWR